MTTELKSPGTLPLSSNGKCLYLWQIMVPKTMCSFMEPDQPFEIAMSHHYEWDDYVRKVAGGVTIFRSAQGEWVEPETNRRYSERMIPVQVACSREDMLKIATFTKEHYNQKKVFFYEVSNRVFIL